MELHQLRYFCAVAHNGNFTRAAKAENVAQPSQILKLEAELGARLFDRFPRSARLTQFGRTFLFKGGGHPQTSQRGKNRNSGDWRVRKKEK